MHQPVLLQEVIDIFQPVDLKLFVDGTFGLGGHSKALLDHHPEATQFIGIELDADARALADPRFILAAGNFADLDVHLDQLNIGKVDGILLDIGVSSLQLDRPERGFSFSKDGPLDMRMDQASELTAAKLLNDSSEAQLATILHEYGELPGSRRIARALVEGRPFYRTKELVAYLTPLLPNRRDHNPVTTVFQALRIAVNDELGVLERVIPQAIERLNPGGRLAIITFHSLEDRIVKQRFATASAQWKDDPTNPYGRVPLEPTVNLLTKKPIVAQDAEIAHNRRARSAKMRVVEKRCKK